MELKHYATITTKKTGNVFPVSETIEIEKKDLSKVKIPKNTIQIDLFDRIFDEISYKGKTYTSSTEAIDNIRYYIGIKSRIEDMQEKNNYYGALKEKGIAEFIVVTCFGEFPVLKGEQIINPNSINKEGYIISTKQQDKTMPKIINTDNNEGEKL